MRYVWNSTVGEISYSIENREPGDTSCEKNLASCMSDGKGHFWTQMNFRQYHRGVVTLTLFDSVKTILNSYFDTNAYFWGKFLETLCPRCGTRCSSGHDRDTILCSDWYDALNYNDSSPPLIKNSSTPTSFLPSNFLVPSKLPSVPKLPQFSGHVGPSSLVRQYPGPGSSGSAGRDS